MEREDGGGGGERSSDQRLKLTVALILVCDVMSLERWGVEIREAGRRSNDQRHNLQCFEFGKMGSGDQGGWGWRGEGEDRMTRD